MRFKNLLGLLAIGGAVAYAQKKRGGDLSLAGIKNSLRGVVDNVKNQINSVVGENKTPVASTSSAADLDRTSSGFSSNDYASGSYSSGYSGNGIDRKY